MGCPSHQIAEHPRRRFDVQVERKIAPVCVPIRPEWVPDVGVIELPQIDHTAHRCDVRSKHTGFEQRADLLILSQGCFCFKSEI